MESPRPADALVCDFDRARGIAQALARTTARPHFLVRVA